MVKFFTFMLASSALVFSGSVFAANSGKLPKGAKPMPSADITAFYAGRSIDWKVAQAFWGADGKAIGYFPSKSKPNDAGFGEGTWTVVDNEMCYHMMWRGKDKAKDPFVEDKCHKLYLAGKKIWIENTKDDQQYQGDIYAGQEKKMRAGDIVSANVTALKLKFGY